MGNGLLVVALIIAGSVGIFVVESFGVMGGLVAGTTGMEATTWTEGAGLGSGLSTMGPSPAVARSLLSLSLSFLGKVYRRTTPVTTGVTNNKKKHKT